MASLIRGILIVLSLPLLFGNSLQAQSQLALSSGSGPGGSVVPLNLSLSSPAGSEPAAIQWTFNYPAGSVANFAVTAGPALAAAAKTLTCASSSTSYICIATGINTNLIANGVVATAAVTLASTAPSATVGVSGALGSTLNGGALTVNGTGGTVTQITTSLLSGISCTPSSLAPGAVAVCTVKLSSPPATAATVALTSTGSITVPASVSVPSNATSATFNATAGSFLTDQAATITATLNSVSATANLSLVASPQITSLQCGSTTLPASSTTICTVTLSKAATTGGSVVTLSSSATSAVTVPASVTVASAATSAIFIATAAAVTSNQTPTITATLNGSTKTATLTITASSATLTSLLCTSTTLAASSTTTCTVTLSKAAPTGGSIVALSSSATSAVTVPASVTVAPASTTATFTATAAAVTSNQTPTITATLNGSTKTVTLTITAAPATLTSLLCGSTTLPASSTMICTVTLSKAAPTGGSIVALSSSATSAVTVPASVTVASAATTAIFIATAAAVTTNQTPTITATLNGSTKTVTLTITAPGPSSLSLMVCSPTTVAPGRGGSCTVTLTSARTSATVVTLQSNNTALTLPASVTVPAGSLTAAFSFTTSPTITGSATVSANLGALTKSVKITVSVAAPIKPSLTLALHCDQRQIVVGGTTVCEIIESPDTASDVTGFTITSSSPRVKAPAMVRGRTGRSTLRFEVSADEAGAQENVTLEARSDTGSASESLLVVSASSVHLRTPKNLIVTPASPVRFIVDAVDDQGLPVSMAVANKPNTATFDPASGLFEWIPADQELGSAEVSFTATNSLGFTQTKTVDIKVVASRPLLAGLRNAAGPGAVAACTPGALAALVGTSLAGSGSTGAVRVFVNGTSAPVIRASSQQVDFVCPQLPPGTPLTISVEAGDTPSNELRTVMEKAAPGLFSLDSGNGLGLVLHARGLAALPRFDRAGMPAVAGDAITLFATGINCDEGPGAPKPLLYVGNAYQQVTLIQSGSFAGVCEVHAVVPDGLPGSEVSLVLEVVRDDGTPLRSNHILMAIEH